MITFALAQTQGLALSPHLQLQALRLLQACKSLAATADATGGLTGTLAAKGISRLAKPSVATKSLIFVVDQVCLMRPDLRAQQECDFLLNGKFWRMVAPEQKGPKGSNSWDGYVPASIVPIALPRSMADANKKLTMQSQPAPMNEVALPPGGPAPQPTGFYATITSTTPTSHYASMNSIGPSHYANMADIVKKPDEGFYANV